MKIHRLLFSVLVISCTASARDWLPSPALMQAICQIESSNGKFLYGDDGRSLGHFQLSRPAWTDVNKWRTARGLPTYAYSSHVMNEFINREYAGNYLSYLHSRLLPRFGREPTSQELYAAYNLGFVGFAKCGFDLHRVNRTTRKKCLLIGDLLNPMLQPSPRPMAKAQS